MDIHIHVGKKYTRGEELRCGRDVVLVEDLIGQWHMSSPPKTNAKTFHYVARRPFLLSLASLGLLSAVFRFLIFLILIKWLLYPLNCLALSFAPPLLLI